MSGNWNGYFTTFDDRPASVLLDLSLHAEAPLRHFPAMVYVRIHMRTPRDDGLSSEEEFGALSAIFDVLEPIVGDGSGVCVGRVNGNARQDYFFYVARRAEFEVSVRKAMAAIPDYRFDIGGKDDPDWTVYFEVLYPSPREYQSIGNRDVCDNLRRNGDDLETPRLIDHCAYFPDEVSRRRFVKHIQAQGFRLGDQFETEDDPPLFGLVFSQLAVPAQIDDYQLPVFDDVMEFGGDYDGWETVLVKSPNPGGP